jgi:hypothetical protein
MNAETSINATDDITDSIGDSANDAANGINHGHDTVGSESPQLGDCQANNFGLPIRARTAALVAKETVEAQLQGALLYRGILRS